jgi:CRISPR-associated protein Cmr3
MTIKQYSFSQLDTWFFREARPYDSIGGSHLNTVFPPTARTMAGAIRTLIGDNQEIDWNEFNQGKTELSEQIGDSEQLGKLQLIGSYFLYEDERLYPMPLTILKKDKQFTRLLPGNPAECDLGKVYLPELEQTIEGAKPLENAWLTATEFQKILQGKIENPDYKLSEELYKTEPRVGIGLKKDSRTVEEGRLYQTNHIRFCEPSKLRIAVMVDGIDEKYHPKTGMIRLGGDGRFAQVNIDEDQNKKIKIDKLHKAKQIFLTLITPANLQENWLPKGFTEDTDKDGTKIWRGNINGVELSIISAVLGKSIREGGWDLAKNKPREVTSLIPAGSVWFCRVESGNPNSLQGYHIGEETEFGRGELAVGIW